MYLPQDNKHFLVLPLCAGLITASCDSIQHVEGGLEVEQAEKAGASKKVEDLGAQLAAAQKRVAELEKQLRACLEGIRREVLPLRSISSTAALTAAFRRCVHAGERGGFSWFVYILR